MRPFPVWRRWFNTLLILGVLVAGPLGYYLHRDKTARRFHVVEPGVLYRSGQLPLAGVKRVHHDYGIRTVISLREGDREDDRDEEAYCKRWGIHHVRIAPVSWEANNGRPASAEAAIRRIRNILSNPRNHPVLIHCKAGRHRTGAFCAVYRMDFNGWTNDQAIDEMRRLGYENIDEHYDLYTFLQRYRPTPVRDNAFRTVSRQRGAMSGRDDE
jgi:protein tyrosine/serine phosphatase